MSMMEKEISSQSGTAETGSKVALQIPEGYKFLYDGSEILKGKGSVGASSLTLSGREAVEARSISSRYNYGVLQDYL